MDEQRVQAYLSLIEKLFGCPSGEEMNILNRHLELMDEGLLQVCEWVAAQLQEEGQDNQAQFVRNVAQKVTAFLRNKDSQTQLYGETYSDGFPKTPQEAVRLSEGLSEIEKQKWYEWIETATPEKQAELVDILHSMWLQHQAQAQEVETFLGQGETEGNQQRDEQRVQAYLWLIQELLACPKGEESDVLIRRQYLIDEGFVQVCGEEAARLQREGRENEAQFVQNVAQEIGEYLNRQVSGVSMGEGQANDNETEPEYLNFLMQVLGTLVANEGNSSVVYPLLQQNLDKLNFKFAETLQKWAVQIFDEVGENKSSAIAALICELADLIQNFPLGNRADNLEIVITANKVALTGLNRQTFPEGWTQTQMKLGVAYFGRIRGEPEENIEFAITHLKAALEIPSRDKDPEEWASNLMILALVYGQRIRGDKAENIEQRIVCYEAALQVYNYERFPKEWALIHQDLAHAYSNRIQGESSTNVEKAIIGYQSALQVYTYELFPEEWAETQMRLGLVYASLLQGDKSENLEIALNHFKVALTVYTFSKFPEKWAKLQTGLGVAYSQRIQGNKSENLEKAIACHEKALTVYNMENYSYEWVMLQKSLGAAYSNRIQGDKSANQKRAITYYNSALKIYTRETFPEDWADTQMSLGWAYHALIRGDLAENLERAIAYFEAALQVYVQSTFSYEWADAQSGLGTVYMSRIRGNKAENLEKAIAFCEAALQVYNREEFLSEWLEIQTILGNAYSIRIRGNKAENLEKAINFCETALQVYTRETYPNQWAATQMSLGNAYSRRIQGNRAENLEKALTSCEAALQVYTRKDFVYEWTSIQVFLGNIYRQRTEGNKAENIEKSIICCERALQVYNHQDYINEWSEIQWTLGIAYVDRIKGKKTDNIEKAIAYLTSALTVYNSADFPYEWANIQMSLGSAYSLRIKGKKADNIEKAIAYLKSALTVYNTTDFPYEWAMAQIGLGFSFQHRIQNDKAENEENAIAFYKNALQVLSPTNFSYGWARIQINLGDVYCHRIRGDHSENLEQAIASCHRGLQVINLESFPYEWGMAHMSLGSAYANRILGHKIENLEQAITFLELALQVFKRENFPDEWAKTQCNLGEVYRKRIRGEESQNIEYSISLIKAGLTFITLESSPQDYALAYMALGNAYSDRIIGNRVQNLEQAIDCFEESSKIYTREAFPDEWANLKNNLGIAYGQLSMASDQYSDRQKSDCIERAIECFKITLQVHTRTSFPKNHTQTLSNLGLAYLAQSRYYSNEPAKKRTAFQNAYTIFEQALDTVEYLRGEIISGDEAKRKLNEEWARLYLGMVEVCLELGRYTDAIEYVDRSKARNLTELIATRDAYPGGEISSEVRQRLQQLRQAISEEDRRLKQDPNPNYTHISQLREEFQANYPYKPLKFSDIQSLLDDETVILEWYVLNDKFLTFTLTNHSLNLWKSSEEDLDNLTNWADTYIDDYRRHDNSQWRNSLPQRLETVAQILHLDEILANLRQNFPNCQKLILIPHRFLHLFPLHALPVATEDGEGKFLQDLFPKGVGYAPNCQVLQQAQNRSRPDFNRLFAIQNPTQDLQFTDMEVEAIQSLFNPHQVLKHDQAEKAAIDAETLKNDHCIHFSCHGYFNFEDALKSSLILAKSEFTPPPPIDDPSRYLRLEDDKLLDLAKCLTLEDILRLDLTHCRLVTLSACETGITDITSTSDEYIGLPSGFILAGSPNVVSTLWAVADISTAIFMIQFYQTLQQQPELAVVLALRQTQTWLRSATVQDLLDWVDGCAVISPERRKQMKFTVQWGKTPESQPFSSPYFWAAFCAIGQTN